MLLPLGGALAMLALITAEAFYMVTLHRTRVSAVVREQVKEATSWSVPLGEM